MEFETYPEMFSDYEQFIENVNYDEELRFFTVPKEWAVDWVFITYRMGIDEFLEEYTWDDTFELYEAAKASNMILSERIQKR